MTTTQRSQIAEALRGFTRQGRDPKAFRLGLASAYGVTVEEVDEMIVALAVPVARDAEDVAQDRLRQDRKDSKLYRDEYRRYNHEEV